MGYDSDTKTIMLGPGSDFMADSGVHFVHVHRDIALKKDAPEAIRRDWSILQDWLGCAGRPLNEIDDENIRLAWMGYYAVGLAPSFNLQPAFDLFGPSVRFVQIRPLGSIPIVGGSCKSASTLAVGQSDSHQIA